MFAPLHMKSEYSLEEGIAPVEDLLRRAADFGYRAAALTDVENLHGQVRFHLAARSLGLRPITGVELRAAPRGGPGRAEPGPRLLLLARDLSGYQSLCRIVSRRRTGDPESLEPLDCLRCEPAGLFFLAEDHGTVSSLLAAGVTADDVRFLRRPGGRPAPADVRPVAAPEVVMLEAADRELRALRMAIARRRRFEQVEEIAAAGTFLPDPGGLRQWLTHEPRALEEAVAVAEQCRFDLLAVRVAPPRLDGGGGAAQRRLERETRERLAAGRAAGRWRAEAYDKRLAHELSVIAGRELAAHFLAAFEIGCHAREVGIEVMGRGSAVASLVVHLLGLSPVDPIEHGLVFERFLHAGRTSLPDLDLDLPSHRRDELIDWTYRRFGDGRVALASALQTFRRRAAFREGLKAFGAGPAVLSRFAAALPDEDLEGEVDGPLPLEMLPPALRARGPLIERLIGRPQHLSAHPGGVVIAGEPLASKVPLARAPKGVIVTQYDGQSLEALGLVKIDLLGNRALAAIEEAIGWIGHAPAMPDQDPATLALLGAGNTVGCFQIETPLVRATLRSMPVRGVRDLVAALAIVRPGPASGRAKAAFLRRAAGSEPADPPHARLATLLADSFGIPLYEEDLIVAFAMLTGGTLEDADRMRAALVSAGDDDTERARLEDAFAREAASQGLSEIEARDVWRQLARFAAYSFHRAHATSYAQLAWACAYLKAHHPAALACGLIDHDGGAYPLRAVAAEFSRRGATLRGPHVHRSAIGCRLEEGAVRIGLQSISRLTAATRRRLLAERPFRDLSDLVRRAAPRAGELEALVLCGACDGFPELPAPDYPFAHEAWLAHARSDAAIPNLALAVRPDPGEHLETYRRLVRVFHEIRFLGMHPSDHPMRVLREEAARAGCVTSAQIESALGRTVTFAGIVSAQRRLAVRAGVVQFVTFEDEEGMLEAVLPPHSYARLGDPIRNPGPFLLTGRVEGESGDARLMIARALPFHSRPRPYATQSAS